MMNNCCNEYEYCNKCDYCNSCKCNNCQCDIDSFDFICEYNCECDKYKYKVNDLYAKAKCVQQECEKSIYESKQLEQKAKELERKAKELYVASKMSYDNACKLESERQNLLELASFYCQKVHECYKNSNYINKYNECCEKDYKYNSGTICNTGCRCISNHLDGFFKE